MPPPITTICLGSSSVLASVDRVRTDRCVERLALGLERAGQARATSKKDDRGSTMLCAIRDPEHAAYGRACCTCKPGSCRLEARLVALESKCRCILTVFEERLQKEVQCAETQTLLLVRSAPGASRVAEEVALARRLNLKSVSMQEC